MATTIIYKNIIEAGAENGKKVNFITTLIHLLSFKQSKNFKMFRKSRAVNVYYIFNIVTDKIRKSFFSGLVRCIKDRLDYFKMLRI